MNKDFVSSKNASESLAARLSTLSFAVAIFSFVAFCGWQPALSQTLPEFPVSRNGLIENTNVSPRLTRSSQTEFAATLNKSAQTNQSGAAADGDIDANFNAGVSEGFGYVEETIVQPDGKIIIGGFFNGVNGAPRNYLARLNADGSPDATFNAGGAGPNGAVLALARQPDGKILIGGNFTAYNGAFRGPVIRLNADGTPDLTFNPGGSANSVVEAVAVQADGKILIGGLFSLFNGVPRGRIARLNPDGSLDTTFNVGVGFNNPVFSIVPQPDGKILVGGAFRSYNGTPVNGIARLNADGSLDATFNPGGIGATVNTQVDTIVLQADGKILVGGFFSSFNGVRTPLGIVRLNQNGTIETVFTLPGLGASVTAIAIAPSGAILIGGTFTNSINVSRGIAVLNAPLGTSFGVSQANGDILNLTVLPNGKILAGGSFTRYNDQERRRLVLLNADGSIDNGFAVSVNTAGVVHRIAAQPDGKVIVAGDFESANGAPRSRIARFNADGSLDAAFNVGSGADGTIFALAVQPDGKILIGGSFIAYNGTRRNQIARLNSDGSLDAAFTVTTLLPETVYDIVLQPDGKILVGGTVTVQFFDGTRSSSSIVRLNTDGSLDLTFDSGGIAGTVRAIRLAADGKIYVGGVLRVPFSQNAGSIVLIARLNQNGSLDSSFNYAGVAVAVEVIDVLPDGKILIGGTLVDQNNQLQGLLRLLPNGAVDSSFNATATVNGTVRALLVQSDGKILIGGFFASRAARLNADGSRDTSFNAAADNFVDDIAIDRNGKILLGGAFTIFNNVPRRGIVRLQGSAATTSRRAMFDYDGDGKADVSVYRPSNGVWYLLNSQTGFSSVQFGIPTDRIVPADYDGDGRTDIAVWRENPNNPDRANFYILNSSNGAVRTEQFGRTGDSPIATADWDGDGKADPAVYRAGTAGGQSFFFYKPSRQQGVDFVSAAWGIEGDKPVIADYDGDGKADIAVYRPSNGVWYIARSGGGFSFVQFGNSTDKPVVSDYDGDGKADQAVYRPSEGTWYINQSARGFTAPRFGISTDLPVPADYDGDGRVDIAVYRPAEGNWYLLQSTLGFSSVRFGLSGDKPTPNAFIP